MEECDKKMKSTVSFGPADPTWSAYNLSEYPLLFNRGETDYKAVVRNGSLVTIVSNKYLLLPNEVAVKVGDVAAEACGLVPFTEFTGDWFARMNSHVLYSNRDTRVHALYALNQSYTVNGDKMHLGVGIHNGIDGHFGFYVGVFTFRVACANMVFAGMPHYEQRFDQRATLEYISKVHTRGLDPALPNLLQAITTMMERATGILDTYTEMARLDVTKELVEKIRRSRLPQKVWPDAIQTKDLVVPRMDQWTFYNDITGKVWHNEKMELRSKMELFSALHHIMPLEVPRR